MYDTYLNSNIIIPRGCVFVPDSNIIISLPFLLERLVTVVVVGWGYMGLLMSTAPPQCTPRIY